MDLIKDAIQPGEFFEENFCFSRIYKQEEMMAKRRSAKQKQPILRYIFLILGGCLLILVLVSWFAFPGWRAQPGGFWALIAAAAVGALGIAKDAVSIVKDVNEIKKNSSRPRHAVLRQTQIALNSEDVDQSMEHTTGSQSQIAKESKKVRQSMK